MTGDLTIFEGCDGVGKTTLARAYAEATNAEYVHHGPYPGADGWGLVRAYAGSIAKAAAGNVVLDRCWISEPIYGAVFRGGLDRLDPHQVASLEAMALAASVLVVVVDAPWEEAVRGFRLRADREMLSGEDQLRRVWDRYEELAHRELPLVRVDAFSLFGERVPVDDLVRRVRFYRRTLASFLPLIDKETASWIP